MTILDIRSAGRGMAPARCRRTEPSQGCEDTPYSPILRSWLAREATRHRALLRNISAAGRIGLGPQILAR